MLKPETVQEHIYIIFFTGTTEGIECWQCINDCEGNPFENFQAKPKKCQDGESCQVIIILHPVDLYSKILAFLQCHPHATDYKLVSACFNDINMRNVTVCLDIVLRMKVINKSHLIYLYLPSK